MTEVRDILLKIGYSDLRDFGKQWRMAPLYRPSDNNTSLAVNKLTGQWYDFSARMGGSIQKLIQLTLNLHTLAEASTVLGTLPELQSHADHKYELTQVKKFDKNLLFKLQKNHEYWENRKISKHIIELFEGGTIFNGKMAYRYVFPIYDENQDLIGFSGRMLNDKPEFPKWKHCGAKSNWLYPLKLNADIITEYKEVILVESIGDMLSLWENGIKNVLVTFGIEVSKKIIEFLLRINIKHIVVAFNNDEDNEFVGNEAAVDAKKKLMSYFDEDQITIAIPDQKDFGVMNSEQINLWKQQHNLKN
jgi:hypothetical protein